MKNIAIIPARGGSKRLPNKNILKINGAEMISYSIRAAINSNLFTDVIVSTDSTEIATIASHYGAKVMQRSEKNSNDYATASSAVIETIHNLQLNGVKADNICCIYPTAVFVTPDIIKKMYNILVENSTDSVISIVKYSHPVERSFTKTETNNIKYVSPEFHSTRTQDFTPRYHDAGQIYWCNTDKFLNSGSYVMEKTYGYELPASQVQDIDTQEDFNIAEIMIKNKTVKYKDLSDYNNIHKNDTVFIIGNGPFVGELTDKQIQSLNTKTTIGCNSSFVAIESDYYIAGHLSQMLMQCHFGKKGAHRVFHGELQDWDFKEEWNVISIANIAITAAPRQLSRPVGPEGPLCGADNVGFSASHLAYIMGASRIIYIGFDLKNNLHIYNVNKKYNEKLLDCWNFTKAEYGYNSWVLDDINDFSKSLLNRDVLERIPFATDYNMALNKFTGIFEVMNENDVEVISAQDDGILIEAGAKYVPLDEILSE